MDILRKILKKDVYYCTYDPTKLNPNYKCYGPYESFGQADKANWDVIDPGILISANVLFPKFVQEYEISYRLKPNVNIVENYVSDKIEK